MNGGPTPAVVLERVSKAFQRTEVVHDVSLVVNTGEFLVLLGPSGSGKTTILRLIAGFEQPTAGSVSIADRNVVGVPPNQRDVGVVFQQLALFPHLSVARNVAFGLEVRGVPSREIRQRVDDALAMVHLSGLADRMPNQLSGGQQQRVALARALVTKPSVLLLDEPLGSLDKNLRAQMQVEIRRLQQDLGISTIMVTHDQEEAMTMGDRIAVLHDGYLEQIAPPAEVYDRPVNRFVATFVGEANLFPVQAIDAAADGLRVTVGPGFALAALSSSPVATGAASYAMVRPEEVRISREPLDGANCFPATVISRVFAGPTLRVKARLENGDELASVLPSSEFSSNGSAIEAGQRVFTHWSPRAVRLIPK